MPAAVAQAQSTDHTAERRQLLADLFHALNQP
jgi:hypothetical protein